MKGAMNGDLVIVRVDKHQPSYRRIRDRNYIVGEVTQVLRRAHRTVVGRFHLRARAVCRAVRHPHRHRHPHRRGRDDGRARRRDGERRDRPLSRPHHALRARAASSKSSASSAIPASTSRSSSASTTSRTTSRTTCCARRRRSRPKCRRTSSRSASICATATSSPSTARRRRTSTTRSKCRRLRNGNYLLGVHIADVAHYVTEGSALDRGSLRARDVGLLPRPRHRRCCRSGSRTASARSTRRSSGSRSRARSRSIRTGRFVDHKIYKSVIRTRERMTYTERERDPHRHARRSCERALRLSHPRLRADARALRDPARAARAARLDRLRSARGRGHARRSRATSRPSAATERNVAHRLIEEFMLAANETVARELVFANQPGLYRVHQQPDAAEARRPQRDPQGVQAQAARRRRGDPARRAAARAEGSGRARRKSAS